MNNTWFAIINPTSGNGKSIKQFSFIINLFKKYDSQVIIEQTKYAHHENKLVQNTINQVYIKFICIGGDGTLHHMINGIMSQNNIVTHQIKVVVIPVGTGNDWIKTHKISKNIILTM